jgi:predicted dehydrogenase
VKRHGIAVIGCGLIGARRAGTAQAHERTELRVVVDADASRADAVAREHGVESALDWHTALERDDVDAIVVCTPNALLVPIAQAALEARRHVLIEKPMGRNAAEARALGLTAAASPRVLKIGFNHRYHPAVARAHELFRGGAIGRLIQMRARYGHGSRPGCENEWRADAQLAGGGELLDQGVHVVDLMQWFAGIPVRVQAELQTAVWPLAPLEDNAFGLLRFADDVIAQLHVSMTQWKNLFSFEVHGELGALVIDGLGGSYGMETLTVVQRNRGGGAPELSREQFDGVDPSWMLEWNDFVQAMDGGPLQHGSWQEGIAVMDTIAALYAAGRAGEPVAPAAVAT